MGIYNSRLRPIILPEMIEKHYSIIALIHANKLETISHLKLQLASINPHETTTIHPVCKFSLAFAQHTISTKNYPTNERSLKAKFTVCALSFVLFSLSSRLGAKSTESCRRLSVPLTSKILFRASKRIIFSRCRCERPSGGSS